MYIMICAFKTGNVCKKSLLYFAMDVVVVKVVNIFNMKKEQCKNVDMKNICVYPKDH